MFSAIDIANAFSVYTIVLPLDPGLPERNPGLVMSNAFSVNDFPHQG